MTLLDRPDRLLGVILLGNNFVNILASAIATVIAIRLLGESGVAVATAVLTVVVLLFAEVAPKTVAAFYPERFAFPASYLLLPLLRIFYPLVWVINTIANGMLAIFGLKTHKNDTHKLSQDELRTVVHESGSTIPKNHHKMLLNIFDLDSFSVAEIMVPRNEIAGIDLNDDWDKIQSQLITSQHTRLPLFRGDIDDSLGILHLRHILAPLRNDSLNKDDLVELAKDNYFIPESTPLNTQLLNFQRERSRIGLIVDEYGDIQGLVTLDDILEEIVGNFTTDPADSTPDAHLQEDGSYLIDGSISVRDLNHLLKWNLPTDGANTLNGLIVEYMDSIPESGVSLVLEGHPLDIVQSSDSAIKIVRIDPALKTKQTGAK